MVTVEELRALPATVRLCQNDPCWCGYHEQLQRAFNLENAAKGIHPWTQEAHDAFLANTDKHRRGS